ncbi:MAG TPA: MBL fold metallo-hydrolase [Dehalococcoidia bacterium]|nr:MBL fold metallo-hydrolase [Dehalococcoidia bacterium]
MEITWLGHSCFRIKGKEATIVTDPYDKTLGYPMRKPTANIVTISHNHPQHCFLEGVAGNPRVVSRPGEYDISNISIYGIPTFHDNEKGQNRGKNTVFFMEIDGVKVCHLGDLGHVPTSEQIEQISDVEILMVPIGGGSTLDAAAAAEAIGLLEPKLVLPMHYKTDVVKMELEPLEKFIKVMGLTEVIPQPKLNITKTTLPMETRVLVLDYQG